MLVRFIRAVKGIKVTPSDLTLAKSDRINALRKQYDAFVEEDKKRKNRNEYILGWLDRVRSAPTLAPPSRHKETPCYSQDLIRKEPEFITQKYEILNPCTTNAIATNTKNIDETTILREVSKNYILIPKKHSTGENIYRFSSSSNTTNDSDWKCKYNILNELKKSEKEELLKEEPTRDISKEHDNKIFTKETCDDSINKFNELNLPMKIARMKEPSEIPPISISPKGDIRPHITETNIQMSEQKDIFINNKNDTEFSGLNSHDASNSDKKDSQTKNEANAIQSPEKLLSKLVLMTQENIVLKPDLSSTQQDLKNNPISDSVKTILLTGNNTSENIDKPNAIKLETVQPIVENNMNIPEIKDTKHLEKPDVQTDENITDNTLNIDSALIESNNMQYQTEVTSNFAENDIEGTEQQIEEYETEQNQLFYSDDTNQNYAYNEEEGQNMQSGNEAYDNTNYSYYEAVKDENNYGPAINEHVEASERYDPNYGQQYISQYDENQAQYPNEYVEKGFYNVPEQNAEYDQTQYENYEQQNYEYQQQNIAMDPQQYGDENTYNNPGAEQESQDTVYEQTTPQKQIEQNESMEQVEQQMDLEDGYVDEQHTVEQVVENKISDERTEEIKQTT